MKSKEIVARRGRCKWDFLWKLHTGGGFCREHGRLSSGEDTGEYEDWRKVGEWEGEGGTRSGENGVLWAKIYSKSASNSNSDSACCSGSILLSWFDSISTFLLGSLDSSLMPGSGLTIGSILILGLVLVRLVRYSWNASFRSFRACFLCWLRRRLAARF